MKKSAKRLISLLLTLAFMLSLLTGWVLAAEESEQTEPDPNAEVVVLETVTEYNPLYDGIFTHEQIDAMEAPSVSKRGVITANNIQYATTIAEAGAQLRSSLKSCQTSFSVYYRVLKSLFDEYGANIIKDVIWDEAMKLTTDGREGDYLNFIWLKGSTTNSYTISDDGNYVFLTINYSIIYATTAAQENEMVARAKETIGNFGFTRQTSAYDKIRTIYNYVTTNIKYTAAENVDNPLFHSAYSAIVLKDTVCQGYALLLYYMFWQCEIPCRYVRGDSHAWNLVWLRGQWYSLDATWDSGNGPDYEFFLRGRDSGFYNTHTPEGSNIISLVNSTSPYDYGAKRTADYGSCTTHTNASSTFVTDDGCTCYWCSACGQSATGSFSAYRYVDGGYCGDNLYWTLDSNGCLQISGSGEMWDNQIVWYPHRNCVLSTELSGQMTSIGNRSFENTDYLPGVWLPMNLTRIGDSAFIGCDSLSWVVLPENIAQIESNAFAYCSALTDVYYEGTPAQWNTITISSGNEYLTNAQRHFGCSISFDANGGTGEVSPQYWFTGLTLTLNSNTFTREGYVFTGWNTKPDGTGTAYADGTEILLSGDLTLYAQWSGKPKITTQPTNVTVAAGKTATFKVAATGATSYQWYYRKSASGSWTAVSASSGKTSTYSLTAEARHNGYQYRCLVKNAAGSVYTNIVTLTVSSEPVITTQPTNVTVAVGNTATFKVTATGATSYQWYYRKSASGTWTTVSASSGKTSSYSLTAEARHNGYQYRCLVKNAAGSVYTNIVTLTVNSGPVITTQPTSKTVNAGSTAQFKVVATGATSYQWYYRKSTSGTWTAVSASSGKTATYSLTAAAKHNGYQYYCKVSNASGSVDSSTVTLKVNSKPVITTQPTSVTVAAGNKATFKVTATGATSYQWYYRKTSAGSWTAVSASSGKTSTYSLTTEARHNGYQYYCEVTNASGSVDSSIVTLTVNSGPVITTQPTSKTVTAGSTATFSVTATGATSYQWYYRTSSTGNWTAVAASSGKTSTYSLTAQTRHNGYQYRCLVKNASGSVYSNTVTLTVADSSSTLYFPFFLYSYDGKVYLGKLVTDKYDQDGLWNEYGTYGSNYSNESAFNEHATKPPKIVDYYGSLVGYLTANISFSNGYSISTIRQFLLDNNQ